MRILFPAVLGVVFVCLTSACGSEAPSLPSQVKNSADSSPARTAGCIQNENGYLNGELPGERKKDSTCKDSQVMELAASCSEPVSEDMACVTLDDLEEFGIVIADFDELSELPVLNERGVLAASSTLEISNDRQAAPEVGECQNGETMNEDVAFGTASYLCTDMKWGLTNVTCLQSTNQYEYTNIGTQCERKNIGSVSEWRGQK